MVKPTKENVKSKGKGAASSSAPPAPKDALGSVKPKNMFKKKKAEADPEKQKAAAVQASASAPAPAPAPADVSTSTATKNDGTADKKMEEERKDAGFIFMCNAKTKPECYHKSVFGLPKGKIDVVRKIRLGTKLFLYDFDMKLLYGAYKPSGKGGMDLVPDAFEGRFTAQVKFKIEKDYLPLPESSFKHAIKDNYISNGRFAQELSSRQVRRLLALFKPVSIHPPSLQHIEERRQTHPFEERMPHYVEERRVPHDYEQRPLSQHDGETQRPRFVEERRLNYDYERRPIQDMEEIRRPQFIAQIQEPTRFQYVPSTYYHHAAPADNNLYNQHQAGIIYDSSAPRASGDGASRDPLLARYFRALPPQIAARSDHFDELYRSYQRDTRTGGTIQDRSYVRAAYQNPRPIYSGSIQRPVSSRLPVSSYYSFDGAPVYR